MLTAAFRGHEGFVLLVVLPAAACAAAVRYPARRCGTPRPTACALWTTHSSGVPGTCTVDRDVLEPFRTVRGRLSAGMFGPLGPLGTLATRRPPVVPALGLLTAGAERRSARPGPFSPGRGPRRR